MKDLARYAFLRALIWVTLALYKASMTLLIASMDLAQYSTGLARGYSEEHQQRRHEERMRKIRTGL